MPDFILGHRAAPARTHVESRGSACLPAFGGNVQCRRPSGSIIARQYKDFDFRKSCQKIFDAHDLVTLFAGS
jgi:hypothetical protein